MGIARFYRWLSERYPLINENICADQIPEFDNLYLDMNGIVHNCSHKNTGGLCVKDEADVFVEAFKYIVRLVHIIRPRRLLYMAVDGCAPRAKMNQQRARRFRAANDAREDREKKLEMGEEITGTPFDSNCITPGTEFMSKLTEQLRFFVQLQIQEDPLWQGMEVILSGPDVPGEGEHKIMDYIRTAKSQPSYDPTTRHCLYGLDADLIMLALASHEPYFALLREEVVFGRQETRTVEQRMMSRPERFQLLHISLLREYLVLEFRPALVDAKFSVEGSGERIIDDFIFFCVLVGNDFLPHLPFAEISEGGLEDLFGTYREYLRNSTLSEPWLVHGCGQIAFERLSFFFQLYAHVEDDRLQTAIDDDSFALGRRRVVGPDDAPDPGARPEVKRAPNAELARVSYYGVKFDMDTQCKAGLDEQRKLFKSFAEGLQWVLFYYYRGPDRASWSWYYPYYHAPMVYDLIAWDELASPGISFDIGQPFYPFQQLMAVLPAHSKSLLPQCYQWLFDSKDSPILAFYPQKFEIDIDGVKVPWGGVTMIPWIDTGELLAAMARAESAGPPLSDAESKRNAVGEARTYRFDPEAAAHVPSTLPDRFPALQKCPVTGRRFEHPQLAQGQQFVCNVLPGCNDAGRGFPTLRPETITSSQGMGIKVFQFESRGKSLIVHLRPKGPNVPREETIREMLQQPCVQIDYPWVHHGKIVAVHTPNAIFKDDGSCVQNTERDHAYWTHGLIDDCRRRGLVIELDGVSDRAANAKRELQAIAEVQALDAMYVDASGQTQYRYRSEREYRLLHLVDSDGPPPGQLQRFPVGAPVVCTERGQRCFGLVGTVVVGGEDGAPEARFELPRLSLEAESALQTRLQEVVAGEQRRVHWYRLEDAIFRAQVPQNAAMQLLGTLHIRGADNVREDIGMSMVVEPTAGRPVLCLPSYSWKHECEWWLSDAAVQALRDYAEQFPGLIKALNARRKADRDLEARLIFPETRDVDYSARRLVKYCNACRFKKLCLVELPYMALDHNSIEEVVAAVNKAHVDCSDAPSIEAEVLKGHGRFVSVREFCDTSASERKTHPIEIGQRGYYAKPLGLVPCGAGLTVVAMYGKGHSQSLDVVLDTDSFGADGLQGCAPPMRGLRVPASDVLPYAMLDAKPPSQSARESIPSGIACASMDWISGASDPAPSGSRADAPVGTAAADTQRTKHSSTGRIQNLVKAEMVGQRSVGGTAANGKVAEMAGQGTTGRGDGGNAANGERAEMACQGRTGRGDGGKAANGERVEMAGQGTTGRSDGGKAANGKMAEMAGQGTIGRSDSGKAAKGKAGRSRARPSGSPELFNAPVGSSGGNGDAHIADTAMWAKVFDDLLQLSKYGR